jgi:Na+-driven multidrug efflux pump
VPLATLLAVVLHRDLVWIWYVLMLDHAIRAAWLARSFQRGGWSRKLDGSV